MTPDVPRSLDERRKDALARFETDIDVWVSTAEGTGVPCLVPLSYLWDGETFLLSTARANPTARNLHANGRARLAFGTTRDVVLVEGTSTTVEESDLRPGEAAAFATRTGFDPREIRSPYPYFRITPIWIQAWREANEIAGRDLMKDGRWLG
ncbi:pyridoxamine 5'-phosphate oxidase family protein [Streptomyces sp. NPDC002889]|uniref:pyridoxamine 5'-phosphate oxidase family protein n=1 Tax=Streptomyces sp. NPDC002889 TaxID=3364669 RepID=UPI0036AE6DD8